MKTLINKIVLLIVLMIILISCSEKDAKPIEEETKDSTSIQQNIDNIVFSDYNWKSKETKDFADSRIFCLTNKQNVSINPDGTLLLKISKIGEYWYGGEITLDTTLGFGEYSFEIVAPQNELDANAHLSLTILNQTDEYYEGLTQTGVRFSKNSDANAKNELEYFMYSTSSKVAGTHEPDKPFLIDNTPSIHKIGIYPDYIYYTSKSGSDFEEFKTFKKNASSNNFSDDISFAASTDNMKVIISLCLADSNEPLSNKTVELIIKNFKFSPANDDLAIKSK